MKRTKNRRTLAVLTLAIAGFAFTASPGHAFIFDIDDGFSRTRVIRALDRVGDFLGGLMADLGGFWERDGAENTQDG